MPAIDIDQREYEKPREAFELCRWVNHKLAELQRSGCFDELYFERKGRKIKKLIEEVIPVSRLALHLSTPGSEVFVTCYEGNQAYDATIEIEGFNCRAFKVEVTTTETDETNLRRQALSRQGRVAFNGPIERDKRNIIWQGEMVEVEANEQRLTDLMFERLKAKVDSGRYGTDTAILVQLAEFVPVSMRNRAKLVHKTRLYLLENQQPVADVYYGYTAGYLVDMVGSHEA
jgi:hypothetical protein